MFGMPVPKSNNGDVGSGGYQYGEYDGVMDVEAILHTTPGAPPTPTVSPDIADCDAGGYGNYVSLHSDTRSGSAATPLARGAPRKPTRVSAGSAQNGDNETIMLSSTATTPRFAGAVADNNPDGAAPSTRHNTRKPMQTDDVVHLPAIGNQQPARKKTSDTFPTRVRAAAPAQDPSKSVTTPTHNGYSRAVGAGAKSVTSVGNLDSLPVPVESYGAIASNHYNGSTTTGTHRPPYHAPPLSPVSTQRRHEANDLNGTKATGNNTIGSSIGASSQDNSKRHQAATSETAQRGDSAGMDEVDYTRGHGEKRIAAHNTAGSSSGDGNSSASKTNGWVKEEARRLDGIACSSPSPRKTATPPASSDPRGPRDAVKNSFRSRNVAQLVASQFPQERMRDKTNQSNSNANSSSSGGGDLEMIRNDHAKVNTSPAPVAPKPHVWTGDYEMVSSSGVGSADLSVVQMPKVGTSRPFANGFKPSTDVGGNIINTRSSAKSIARTATQTFHPPPSEVESSTPGNGSTSPTESAITPVRRVFTRPQKPASSSCGAAVQTGRNTSPPPHAPPMQPPTSPTTAATGNPLSPSDSMPHSAAGSSSPPPARVPLASGVAALAARGDKQPSSLHTSSASHRRIMNAVDTSQQSLIHSRSTEEQVSLTHRSSEGPSHDSASASGMGLPYTDERRAALEAWADVPVLTVTIRGQTPTPIQNAREEAKMCACPANAQQMYPPVNGQGRQEVAGEPCDMNYDVHNVVVQLRHRNRPLMMNYPPRLPLEMDMRPRLRRQRTPRSFYGNRMPHVGDAWFREALKDVATVKSPDLESLEKREEAEFIRNGGDPATRRNRYGQANKPHAQQQQQQQQQRQRPPQQRGSGGADAGAEIDVMNRNALRMEQAAS
ncbi:hypothetical protein JKF63_05973 [Porcisia hertigi]|uniref:Uncharacterized protein n=1 Tax=Porcisia hertigi TaxID=2761500 RepID=A0A836IWP9_9TRYP|nr:hypothetical protein JKF63_05973 [Porcisia hertigi]